MTPRMDSPWWRDTMGDLSIGDVGGAPVPTVKLKRRVWREQVRDMVREYVTCDWPGAEPSDE